MKYSMLVAALCCSLAQLWAQNPITEPYADRMADVFEHLDLTTFNPPNLHDYGVPLGNFLGHIKFKGD